MMVKRDVMTSRVDLRRMSGSGRDSERFKLRSRRSGRMLEAWLGVLGL